jgi:hypothetical protein
LRVWSQEVYKWTLSGTTSMYKCVTKFRHVS